MQVFRSFCGAALTAALALTFSACRTPDEANLGGGSATLDSPVASGRGTYDVSVNWQPTSQEDRDYPALSKAFALYFCSVDLGNQFPGTTCESVQNQELTMRCQADASAAQQMRSVACVAAVTDLNPGGGGGGQQQQPTDRGLDGTGYYMTLIGYQVPGLFNPGRDAHTFASFSTVTVQNGQARMTDEFTISWLPAYDNGEVVVGKPVPGANYTLQQTMAMARSGNREARRWGPFPVTAAMLEYARFWKQRLDQWGTYGTNLDRTQGRNAWWQALSRRIRAPGIYYAAIDPNFRPGNFTEPPAGALNCFHSISDMLAAQGAPMLRNGTSRGWSATDEVLTYFLTQTWGQIFVDYPAQGSNGAAFVQRYAPIAQAMGIANVPHTPTLPVLPANAVAVGAGGGGFRLDDGAGEETSTVGIKKPPPYPSANKKEPEAAKAEAGTAPVQENPPSTKAGPPIVKDKK